MALRIADTVTFIHVPKNAGTSIIHWTRLSGLPHRHSARDHDRARDLDPAWLDRTVAVMRDPWHRLVSSYLFGQRKCQFRLGRRISTERRRELEREMSLYETGLENWLLNHPDPSAFLQSDYLPVDRTNCHIIPFDRVSRSWSEFARSMGWPNVGLPHSNANPNTDDYDSMHTAVTRAWVREHLHADLELAERYLV